MECKKDISKWQTYSLEKCKDMFSQCDAPKPWWLQFEDEPHIGKAIQAYDLKQKLLNQLPIKEGNKKIKI